MRALIAALLILAVPARADMAADAAAVEALALSGPPLGLSYVENLVTVFDNGFGGSLEIEGCRAEAIRRDTGTRDDTIVARTRFDIDGLNLGRASVGGARDAVVITFQMRHLAEVARLDTSMSAALTDKVAGGLSYVVTHEPEFTFRLEGTNDREAARRLLDALGRYQVRYCPP